MAKTGEVRFKNKDGVEYVFTVKELTDALGDRVLDTLGKKGIHIPENAPLKERKELGKETLRQIVEKIGVIEASGREREATKMERLGLLAFDSIGKAVIDKAKELNQEEEAEFELVSGNSDAPSESSSG